MSNVVTFVNIEDEFNRLFELLSARERIKNSRLAKHIQKIRLRLQGMKEELKRKRARERSGQ